MSEAPNPNSTGNVIFCSKGTVKKEAGVIGTESQGNGCVAIMPLLY